MKGGGCGCGGSGLLGFSQAGGQNGGFLGLFENTPPTPPTNLNMSTPPPLPSPNRMNSTQTLPRPQNVVTSSQQTQGSTEERLKSIESQLASLTHDRV